MHNGKRGEEIKLVADVAIFHQGKVLLVTYIDTNKYDHQQGWFLPDDLIAFAEHPEDAIQRIIREQLGTELPDVRLAHIESFQGNDSSWHLVFHYRGDLQDVPEFDYSNDLNQAEWFDVENLPDMSTIAHRGWAAYTIQDMLEGGT